MSELSDPPTMASAETTSNFSYLGLPLNPSIVKEDASILKLEPGLSAETFASIFPGVSPSIPGTITESIRRKSFPSFERILVVATKD